MTRRWFKSWFQMAALAGIVLLGVAACVWRTEHKIETVHKIDAHIVLDIRQIRAESAQVEDYVRGGSATPTPAATPAADNTGKPTSMAPRHRSLLALLDPAGAAWAADEKPEPPPTAAEEKAAIEARRARFKKIDELLTRGTLGENDHGYVEPLGESKKDKALDALAKEENKDRRTIYRGIAARRGQGRVELGVVEMINAEEIRGKLKPGQPFQAPRDKAMFKLFADSRLGKKYPTAKPGEWLKKVPL